MAEKTTPTPAPKKMTPTEKLRAENERLRRELEQVRAVKHEQLVALNVRVPKGVRDRARAFAHEHDTTIRVIVERALVDYLDAEDAAEDR